MIGDRLRQARTVKKLSQRQLASIINVKHNSICDWEKNRHNPNPEQVRQLCDTLEIDPNWLYGKKESEQIRSLTANDFLTGKGEELPEEAKKELDNFIEYLKVKYEGSENK